MRTCTGCKCGRRRYHVQVAQGPNQGARMTSYAVCHAWAVRVRNALARPASYLLVEVPKPPDP